MFCKVWDSQIVQPGNKTWGHNMHTWLADGGHTMVQTVQKLFFSLFLSSYVFWMMSLMVSLRPRQMDKPHQEQEWPYIEFSECSTPDPWTRIAGSFSSSSCLHSQDMFHLGDLTGLSAGTICIGLCRTKEHLKDRETRDEAHLALSGREEAIAR